MGKTVRRILFFLSVGLFSVSAGGAPEAWNALPPELRARGGLCVVVGGAEHTQPMIDLLAAGPWVIHGLDARPEVVDRARDVLREKRLYGRITLESWTSERLPYADHLVNLLVVPEAPPPVARAEILRVLAPGGMALIASDGEIARLVKPRPEEMGEWTHPWHGPDGSLASDDRALEPPNTFQWIAGPPFPMDRRKDSAGVVLSAGGRIFAITQNVPENLPGGDRGHRGPNYLIARDAFNGLPLWSRRWEGPLSRGHADAVHEAIVATADRVFGSRENAVVVFDAATGRELATWETGATPDKLILDEGVLVAQGSDGLTGFDIGRGARLWHREVDSPWNTVADGGRVFALVGTREQDGRWLHELVALDLRSGRELWRERVESRYGHRNTAVLRIQFAAGGIVCLVERRVLRAVAAEDGRELWRRESQTEARGSGGMDSRQVGHFFSNGLVWMREERASGGREAPETWLALDPLTGEVRRDLATIGPQGVISSVNKISCQPLTATARFVMDARLSTFWDKETGERAGWKFARGSCQVGLVPANGLAYSPPNACGCLDEQFLGFLSLVRSDDAGMNGVVRASLERGPAYGQPAAPVSADAAPAWPMYRGSGPRGAYLPSTLSGRLRPEWRVRLEPGLTEGDEEWRLQFGTPWTPPVAAEGLVLLAEPITHQVIALDERTGAERWRYTAGGRVSVPPTLYRGLVLFGAHDGYVYALRAADGALAWRLRAAPSQRRIVAYGQVESTWPVAGGVLVHNGVAYAAAGRAVDAGGGLVVHAIEPDTGQVRWTSRIVEAHYGNLDPLVTDGESIYVMDRRIDPRTGRVDALEGFRYRQSARGGAAITYPDGIRYLRGGKRSMLENSWTQLDMGLRKAQSAWTWADGIEGEILAFTGDRAYAFLIDTGGEDNRGRPRMWGAPVSRGGGRIEARDPGASDPAWAIELPAPAQVEAMLVTENVLLIAGPLSRAEGGGEGFLRLLTRDGGSELQVLPLPVAPVHDGLAATPERVIAVLRDGNVVSFRVE